MRVPVRLKWIPVLGLAVCLAPGCEPEPTAPCEWATLRVTIAERDGSPAAEAEVFVFGPGTLEGEGDAWLFVAARPPDEGGVAEFRLPTGEYLIAVTEGGIFSDDCYCYSDHGWGQGWDDADVVSLKPGDVFDAELRYASLLLRAFAPGSPDPIPWEPGTTRPLRLASLGGWPTGRSEYTEEGPIYHKLYPGPYLVQTWAIPEEYAWGWFPGVATYQEADTVWALGGQVTVVDFPLQRGGSLCGHVQLPAREILDEYRSHMYAWLHAARSAGFPGHEPVAVSLEDGTYSFTRVMPGDYFLEIVAGPRRSDTRSGWYRDGWAPADPETVHVLPGETVSGLDWGVSAILLTARGAHAEPVWGVHYSVLTEGWERESTVEDEWEPGALALLPAGLHRIRAVSQGRRQYLPQWWQRAEQPEDAEPVRTEAGEVTVVEFRLEAGASIVGAAWDAEGRLLPSYLARSHDFRVAVCDTHGTAVDQRGIDVLGEYSFAGLPEGTYLIRATPRSGSGYRTTWYPASLDIESAERISLTPPEKAEAIHVYVQSE